MIIIKNILSLKYGLEQYICYEELNNFVPFHYQKHREDGPALESVNCKFWYKNGKIHRGDGPAVEYADGTQEFYLNNKKYEKLGFYSTVGIQ